MVWVKLKGERAGGGGANSAILRTLSLGYATGVGDGGGGGLTQSCNTYCDEAFVVSDHSDICFWNEVIKNMSFSVLLLILALVFGFCNVHVLDIWWHLSDYW